MDAAPQNNPTSAPPGPISPQPAPPIGPDPSPTNGKPVDNTIQPGQFVVAGGDESSVFKQPPPPEPLPPSNNINTGPSMAGVLPPTPILGTDEPLPTPSPSAAVEPMPTGSLSSLSGLPQTAPNNSGAPDVSPLANEMPQPAINLAGTTPPQSTLPQTLETQASTSSSAVDQTPAGQQVTPQPDPTPYAPPPESTTPPVQEKPSKIKSLRTLAIGGGIVVLLGIIGAVVWFFVLGNKPQPATKVDTTQQLIEEPPPLPKRTGGGFAELPPATTSAREATSSQR